MSARRRARSTRKAEGLDPSRALQAVLYRSAKQDPNRRFHALYDKVARSDILQRAWGEVRANRGAPGVDGMTIEVLEGAGVESFLEDIATALRERTYRPAPLRRVDIPKAGQPGRFRSLGIPTVRDRVVMTAAKIVLEPIWEADFLPVSFGFRPGRSAHQALEAVRVEANRGAEWVLDADLADCFGQVSHGALIGLVAERVSDRDMLKLIRSRLRAGVLRPQLSPKERSLVTVAALTTGGNTEQLVYHLGLATENGATEEGLIEAITHLAFYACWPKAMSAMAVAKQVFRGDHD